MGQIKNIKLHIVTDIKLPPENMENSEEVSTSSTLTTTQDTAPDKSITDTTDATNMTENKASVDDSVEEVEMTNLDSSVECAQEAPSGNAALAPSTDGGQDVEKTTVSRIEDILSTVEERDPAHKTIDVFKEVEANVDTGSLYVNDMQPVDVKKLRADTETF